MEAIIKYDQTVFSNKIYRVFFLRKINEWDRTGYFYIVVRRILFNLGILVNRTSQGLDVKPS